MRVPDPPVWLSLAFVASLLVLAYTMRLQRFWRWLSLATVLALFALIFYHPFAPQIRKGNWSSPRSTWARATACSSRFQTAS
jgi:hypothetical protein